MASWFGLWAFTALACVQSLFGELKSCKHYSTTKKKKRKRGGEREEKEEYKLLTMTKYRTKCCMRVCVLSWIRLFATPWTVASQGPLSMEFPRQEYWGGLPFPTP